MRHFAELAALLALASNAQAAFLPGAGPATPRDCENAGCELLTGAIDTNDKDLLTTRAFTTGRRLRAFYSGPVGSQLVLYRVGKDGRYALLQASAVPPSPADVVPIVQCVEGGSSYAWAVHADDAKGNYQVWLAEAEGPEACQRPGGPPPPSKVIQYIDAKELEVEDIPIGVVDISAAEEKMNENPVGVAPVAVTPSDDDNEVDVEDIDDEGDDDVPSVGVVSVSDDDDDNVDTLLADDIPVGLAVLGQKPSIPEVQLTFPSSSAAAAASIAPVPTAESPAPVKTVDKVQEVDSAPIAEMPPQQGEPKAAESTDDSNTQAFQLATWAIVLVAVSAGLVLACVSLAVVVCVCRRRRGGYHRHRSDREAAMVAPLPSAGGKKKKGRYNFKASKTPPPEQAPAWSLTPTTERKKKDSDMCELDKSFTGLSYGGVAGEPGHDDTAMYTYPPSLAVRDVNGLAPPSYSSGLSPLSPLSPMSDQGSGANANQMTFRQWSDPSGGPKRAGSGRGRSSPDADNSAAWENIDLDRGSSESSETDDVAAALVDHDYIARRHSVHPGSNGKMSTSLSKKPKKRLSLV